MSRSIRDILTSATTIAVVGASRDPEKAGGSVPLELRERGFTVIPVNPGVDELWGERAFASVADVDRPLDVVEVFRPSEDAPEIARQAAAIGAKVIWLQEGIVSEGARRIAEAAGLDFVQDRCMGVESRRFDIHKP